MYRKRLYTTVSKYIPSNLEKMNIKDKNKLLNQLATLKQENKQNIDLTLPKIVEMNSIIKTNPSIDNKKLLNDYLDIVQNSNNEIPKINDSIDEIYESINEEEIYLNDEHNIKGGKSKRNKTRMKSNKKKNNKSRRFNKKMKGGALENEHELLDAINNKNIETVVELIDKGVDVNFFLPYDKFPSPLINAVKDGNDEIIKLLIEKGGADMYIKNRLGRAAVDYMDPSDYQQFGVEPSYQNKFIKKGVYELREYNGYHIPITIIPKGTILFRNTIFDENDFCGINTSDDWEGETYCLYKNMNVFFYPYPAYYEEEFKIFVVERTLKIVNLIYPSYLTHTDMIGNNHKHDFMQESNIVEPNFCSKYEGLRYDLSFLTDFLRVNGDIAGYIGLVSMDTTRDHEDKYEDLNNYSLFHRDVAGMRGVPEIVLYPKQERMLEERIWNIKDCQEKPNNFLHLFDSLDHTINTNEDRVEPNIMELLLSPKGYEVDRISSNKLFVQKEFDRLHVTIYNPLKLYVLWEYLPEEYKKDCVPINWSAKSKLTQFQSDINNLNEGLYKTNFQKFGDKSNKKKRNNHIGGGAFFSRPNQEPEIEEDNYQRVHRVPHSMVFDFDSNGNVVDLTSTGERGKWMFDVTHNSIDSILRIQLARYLTTIDNLQSRIADFPENSQISYPYNHYIHELHDSEIKYLELVKIYTYIQNLPVAVSSVSNYSHDVHILEDPHPNERYPNQVGLPVATLTSNNTTRNNRRNDRRNTRRFGGKKKKTRKNKK